MKLLFLIADGMGDWPLEELNGRTILEAADTPHMDQLAGCGTMGLCRTVPGHMPPGSDVANMALLGFDPELYHTGRGPIEAAAQGLNLDPDDLVFRLNLVTVSEFSENGTMLDYSAGHIDTAVAAELIEDLRKNLGSDEFEFHPGVQYRHLLVQKHGASKPEAELDINPPHDITDKPIAQDLKRYASSLGLSRLLFTAAERLARPGNKSKANSIWPWGQGRPLVMPGMEETYGLKGAVITAVDLVRGLGRAAGMEVLDVEGATGLLDTNYEGKVEAALKFLDRGDFVYLHVEAPDECGHGGDIPCKIEAVQRFDERIVAPLRMALEGTDAAYVICCDHLTPIVERTHVHDPVPFLMAGKDCGVDCKTGQGQSVFNENTARDAGLLIEKGHELLPWVLKQIKMGKSGG